MKTNELPEGWVWTTLGAIVRELNSGFACGVHNSSGDGIPHLRPMNVTSGGAISLKDLRSVSAASYDKLRAGDVLFNNTNSTELVGKTGYIAQDTDWGYSNHMTRLRFNLEYIEPKYVAHYLHNLFYEGYFRANCNNHVSQASISAKFLASEVEIPLPPLAEQRRIVAKLDALMERLDASRARLERVPTVLKRFRQAVLAAAVAGRLTEAWRAQQPEGGETGNDVLARVAVEIDDAYHKQRLAAELAGKRKPKDHRNNKRSIQHDAELAEIPASWMYARLEELSYLITDGAHHTPTYVDEGVKFLSVKNIRPFSISTDNTRFITPEQHAELSTRCNPEKGDILYTKIGSVGYAAVNELEEEFSLFVSVALIKPVSQHISVKYLELALNSETTLNQAKERVKGIGTPDLHLVEIRDFKIPLPPLAEQQEIVRQVNHYFALADALEARLEQATALVEQLPQALLARAFRGELVPQDPTDEPAAALLARLRAEAAAAPAKGKRGPKAKAAPLFE